MEDLLKFLDFGEQKLSHLRAFFAISDDDLTRLASLRPFAEAHTASIVDRFYEMLLADEEACRYLGDEETVSRLRRTQSRYFLSLFCGELNLEYVRDRLRVGAVHERIGLPQHLYLGAYRYYLELVAQHLRKDEHRAPTADEDFAAIQRIVFFDMALATDTYRAAADLRASQEALRRTEALRTLGQMSAVVAHEVKNPLASIAGVVQVIRTRFDGESREASILDDLLERVKGLNNLVEDLLQFARPSSPQRVTTRSRLLVAGTVELFNQNPSHGAVSVRISGEDALLSVDVQAIQRVLLNLMLNAAQAMDGAGEIAVHTEVQGDRCVITIADEGPGIDEATRARIFEPFFTSKARGTGLGLPIARRMVEAHDGALSFTCPDDGGTVFSIALPVSLRD